MSKQKPYQALVFGASGVTGHAILKNLLNYPDSHTFDRVVGLTNRPLTKEDALLPDDDRLGLVSGLDLTDREETLQKLKGISGVERTTHVFFTAYTGHGSDFQTLKEINSKMLWNALEACGDACPRMEYFTLQTGGKVRRSGKRLEECQR